MKKLLLIPFLLLSFSAMAQTIYMSNFNLIDNDVVYSRIFESEAVDLKTKLLDHLHLTAGIKDIKDRGNYILADIENMYIDFDKQGKKGFHKLGSMSEVMNGKVRIDINGNKYRVVVLDMEFVYNNRVSGDDFVNVPFENVLLKKQRTELRDGAGAANTNHFLSTHLITTFTIRDFDGLDGWQMASPTVSNKQ
jgi:hypothetical protein